MGWPSCPLLIPVYIKAKVDFFFEIRNGGGYRGVTEPCDSVITCYNAKEKPWI